MRQKIKLIDKISNKIVEKEVEMPNKMHLEAQIKYKSVKYRDKTKYTRKQKHRQNNNEGNDY